MRRRDFGITWRAAGIELLQMVSSGSALSGRWFHQQGGDAHQVVGEHGRTDQQVEALDAFGQTALHAAEQHGDAALDAGPEARSLLEGRRLLVGFALWSFLAAGLRDARHVDAGILAERQVAFAEEAAIRTVRVRGAAEDVLVAFQRRFDMVFVRRISLEHFVLRDQAPSALGEKHLVAELDRRLHLAALDQVGVRLEDREDLLGVWHPLALDHAAARLVDHATSQPAVVVDLLSQPLDRQVAEQILAARLTELPERRTGTSHDLLGNTDELAILAGLPAVPLRGAHPLDGLHPPPCGARAVVKPLDAPPQQPAKPDEQARE